MQSPFPATVKRLQNYTPLSPSTILIRLQMLLDEGVLTLDSRSWPRKWHLKCEEDLDYVLQRLNEDRRYQSGFQGLFFLSRPRKPRSPDVERGFRFSRPR